MALSAEIQASSDVLSGNWPNRILCAAFTSLIEVRILQSNQTCFLDATNVIGRHIPHDKCDVPFLVINKRLFTNELTIS